MAALKDAQMAPPYQDRGIMAKDAVKLFRMALAALDAHADHAAEVERLEQRLLDQHHELAGLHEHNAILAERVRVLEEALRNIVAHEVDYMTRNHLGDPEKQSYIIQARAALAQPQQKEGSDD